MGDVGANSDHGNRRSGLVYYRPGAQLIDGFSAVGVGVDDLPGPATLCEGCVDDFVVLNVSPLVAAIFRYMLTHAIAIFELGVCMPGLIEVGHDTVDVGDGHRVLDLVECQRLNANFFRMLAKFLLELGLLGDVTEHQSYPMGAIIVGHGEGLQVNPDSTAVTPDHAQVSRLTFVAV